MKRSSLSPVAAAAAKLERKTVERNRRLGMRSLCFKLSQLLANVRLPQEVMSQRDPFEQAAAHINNLQERIKQLKSKRDLLANVNAGTHKGINDGPMIGIGLPQLEMKDLGACLELALISGTGRHFLFSDVINVLDEEGLEVVNASYSSVGDKVFHIIHSQVAISRLGYESNRVYARLKELIHCNK